MRLNNLGAPFYLFLFVLAGVGTFSFPGFAQAFSGAGTGIGGDPYVITSCAELLEVDNDMAASYALANDLDCTANGNDAVVGVWNSLSFSGEFDGNGHTVTVDINEVVAGATGFFSKLAAGATIFDLRIAGSITGTGIAVGGGIAGYAAGSADIARVVNTATIQGDGQIGGIVGLADDVDISDSYNIGSVASTLNGVNVGGLVGYFDAGSITNSYNGGVVGANDQSSSAVGGLVGRRSAAATISNSFNFGEMRIATSTYFGALFGIDAESVSPTIELGYSNNYFDSSRAGTSVVGHTNDNVAVNAADFPSFFTEVNANDSQFDYFKTNSVNPPLDAWDFDTVWETNMNGYPSLISIQNDGGSTNDNPEITFEAGDGTSENPYQITTCNQLQLIQSDLTVSYELTSDVDCSATSTWNGGDGFSPLGDEDNQKFTGTFNGNGHTITDLFINRPGTTFVGLFGFIESSATVEQVGMVNVDITGFEYVGGLSGFNDGTVSKSFATGAVTGEYSVGGLIGRARGGLTNSNSYAIVDVDGEQGVGGFVGTSQTNISKVYAAGTLVSASTSYDGGVVGDLAFGVVSDSYWDAEVGISVEDSEPYGTGLTTAEMKDSATFVDWDFDTIWDIDPLTNNGYPFLRAPNAPIDFDGGTGIPEDPYQISMCGQLMSINESLGSAYLLKQSLDCTADGNDIMIGSDENPFVGIFDGDDYTITVAIDSSEDNIGLFRETDGAIIRSLTVAGTVSGGTNYTGGVVGYAYDTTMEDIVSQATVTGTRYDVGGIAGHFEEGEISDSSATGAVTGTDIDAENIGGLVGHGEDSTIIEDSFSTSDVSGYANIGGLVGYLEDAAVIGSYATGSVEGENKVGGLVGYYEGDDQDKIFHSYSTGNVSGVTSVGGLVGYVDPSSVISQSYATGDVSADGGDDVGAFVGTLNESAQIRNSYARGDVELINVAGYTGGFVGGMEGALVINSYSTGTATNEGSGFVGGFVGASSEGEIFYSFWDTQTSGSSVGCSDSGSCGVSGKTTLQMKTESTFTDANWNFDTIWDIDEGTNNGYPYLLGGADVVPELPNNSPIQGPVETILSENQFHGGGEAQGWNDDDDEWEYELPFSFTFYGVEYSTVWVSSNGYLGFTDDVGDYDFNLRNGIGAPIITAMAKDMVTDQNEGDDIYITDNGDGMVIFRWQATDYDNYDSISNFEIVLHDDSSFEINYGDQTEPLAEGAPVGVHDGVESYVESEYDERTNFDSLNTSAWEWEGGIERPRLSGGSRRRIVKERIEKDEPNQEGPKDQVPVTPTECPAAQILNQNLKTGARNGRYHPYTQAVVTQAHILQGHLNRLGFNSGPADGILGLISDGAIKRMQTYLGTKADGYVGPITRALINASCGSTGLQKQA